MLAHRSGPDPGVFLSRQLQSILVADQVTSRRFFPYEEGYPNQAEAIDTISRALTTGTDVLFEGACGTGKTLAALTPALAHARDTNKTVVITTNVHQQMRQFIAEARRINETEPIRAIVFRGKSSMCHIDVGYEECRALRDSTHELVDLEQEQRELKHRAQELLDQAQAGDEEAAQARSAITDELSTIEDELEEQAERNTCRHYYANLAVDPGTFESWLFEDVRTPDEIYDWADERGLCGYELLKDTLEDVDLVVCNYHHLLDPIIREQFFRWLDRDPEEVIAIFDEAHNIEQAARDHAGQTLSERTLDAAIDECREYDDNRADVGEQVFRDFRSALQSAYADVAENQTINQDDWSDIEITLEGGTDALTRQFKEAHVTNQSIPDQLEAVREFGQELDRQYESAYKRGDSETRQECPTRTAAAFIDAYLEKHSDTEIYPVVSVTRSSTGDIYGRAELYTCLPETVTQPLFAGLHASILMSATLRPFEVTAQSLGLSEPETMAFSLPFPLQNRRTFAVNVPPLFAADRDDPHLQETVTTVLEDAIKFTPGNVLVFFPSYAEADRYTSLVETGGSVYCDKPGTRVESMRQSFVESSDAALFTSVWGTLTEGVSFDGDAARSVIVVGVPYPHLNDRLRAVQDAYADAFDEPDAGWKYAVEVPTVRKTRQALGRVIRSPAEVGTRLLIDRRYTEIDMGQYSVRETFPPEEQNEIIDVAPDKLRYALLNFYSDHDLWSDARPQP